MVDSGSPAARCSWQKAAVPPVWQSRHAGAGKVCYRKLAVGYIGNRHRGIWLAKETRLTRSNGLVFEDV